jgi:hypothetical protein
MTNKEKSGRAITGILSLSIVLFKHASDYIFIDVYSKLFVDLLREPRATKQCVKPFQFSAWRVERRTIAKPKD